MADVSRIVSDPSRRSGQPCVRGTRITVFDVLDYLASGMSPADIIAEYQWLTLDDVQACCAYAAAAGRAEFREKFEPLAAGV